MYSKKDLFKKYELKKGTMTVESWGGEINLVGLSIGGLERMRKAAALGNQVDAAVIAIIESVVDDKGTKIFSDDDMSTLLEMSIDDINMISAKVMDISGLGEEAPK